MRVCVERLRDRLKKKAFVLDAFERMRENGHIEPEYAALEIGMIREELKLLVEESRFHWRKVDG